MKGKAKARFTSKVRRDAEAAKKRSANAGLLQTYTAEAKKMGTAKDVVAFEAAKGAALTAAHAYHKATTEWPADISSVQDKTFVPRAGRR